MWSKQPNNAECSKYRTSTLKWCTRSLGTSACIGVRLTSMDQISLKWGCSRTRPEEHSESSSTMKCLTFLINGIKLRLIEMSNEGTWEQCVLLSRVATLMSSKQQQSPRVHIINNIHGYLNMNSINKRGLISSEQRKIMRWFWGELQGTESRRY